MQESKATNHIPQVHLGKSITHGYRKKIAFGVNNEEAIIFSIQGLQNGQPYNKGSLRLLNNLLWIGLSAKNDKPKHTLVKDSYSLVNDIQIRMLI